jgi:hypothetical protein
MRAFFTKDFAWLSVTYRTRNAGLRGLQEFMRFSGNFSGKILFPFRYKAFLENVYAFSPNSVHFLDYIFLAILRQLRHC